MGHFDYKKYKAKADKRKAWEETVARYGLEVAKIVVKNERKKVPTRSTSQVGSFNKRYHVPTKEEL